jgi:Amt family ammonium transporter
MHYIPGLRLRVSEETEIIGIDESDMGEFAYDYVGLLTELQPSAYNRNIYAADRSSDLKEQDGAGS